MVVSPRPPVLAAATPAEIAGAVATAERNSTEGQRAREDARVARADSLAYLIGTEAGKAFLDSPRPRALARGEPAAQCPAVAVATGPTRGGAVEAALSDCLAALGAAERARGCGCRILAYDGVAAVPREALAYATGVSARLRVPALGIDGLFVAEEIEGEALILRDLGGVVGRIESTGEGDARVVLADGAVFEGRRIAVGFRRGRLAERIYAEDDRGRRLALLVGFAPDELAGGAGAWLAWPRAG